MNGKNIFCFLDGDVARLIRFKNSVMALKLKFGIVCFPNQIGIVNECFGYNVKKKVVTIEQIKKIFLEELK